ncbi:single-stranded DNA-binding protein [Arthrobacter sp. ISL-72]|uniref:single-stranded DNA-binding protein n=1 Tax=Arthrobacter sp. ISL-72 TaxID=2819114 RepID=UPI001BE910AE|nr:single-stranded DNA-binding protein [Arthrobacter sp. ISL-72]MBT2594761.1 single-stranded DNA-binding protein [Arthrobacter sp. ISL-72]
MTDNITVRGFVATEIRSSTTPGGVATASFRLGSTDRRYDRASSTWVDGNTNWFTVQGYRQLAGNMGCSIKKGQRVIIVGRLKMRSWEKDGRIYHAAEIDADSVGHDLMWGSANFIRTAGNAAQAERGQGQPGSTSAEQDGSMPGSEEPDDAREGSENGQDDDPAAEGIFIDDANGEMLQLDSETGELTGTAP